MQFKQKTRANNQQTEASKFTKFLQGIPAKTLIIQYYHPKIVIIND